MAIRKHTKTTDPLLTIKERIALIVGNVLGIHPDDIIPSKRLQADFDADSIDLLDLVYSMEDEFDLSIPDRDIEKFRTVGDLANYITVRLSVIGQE